MKPAQNQYYSCKIDEQSQIIVERRQYDKAAGHVATCVGCLAQEQIKSYKRGGWKVVVPNSWCSSVAHVPVLSFEASGRAQYARSIFNPIYIYQRHTTASPTY